jgi:hypothetical protein
MKPASIDKAPAKIAENVFERRNLPSITIPMERGSPKIKVEDASTTETDEDETVAPTQTVPVPWTPVLKVPLPQPIPKPIPKPIQIVSKPVSKAIPKEKEKEKETKRRNTNAEKRSTRSQTKSVALPLPLPLLAQKTNKRRRTQSRDDEEKENEQEEETETEEEKEKEKEEKEKQTAPKEKRKPMPNAKQQLQTGPHFTLQPGSRIEVRYNSENDVTLTVTALNVATNEDRVSKSITNSKPATKRRRRR